MNRQSIFLAINIERNRQNHIHPEFSDNPILVLTEELGEISTAIQNKDNENLKEELIQLASSCVRWLEKL